MTICSAHQKTEDLIAGYCELQKLYGELWSHSLAAENIVKRVVFVDRERVGERAERVWAAQSGIWLKNHRKLQAFQHRLIQSRAEHSFDVGVQAGWLARMSQIRSEQKRTSAVRMCDLPFDAMIIIMIVMIMGDAEMPFRRCGEQNERTNERTVQRHHMQRL